MFSKIALKINALVIMCLIVIILPLGFIFGSIEGEKEKQRIIDKTKNSAMVGAIMVGQFLSEAVHSQLLTRAQVFDTSYVKIPGFSPPKYQTEYSTYTDRVLLNPQDSFLKDPNIEYAAALDNNGYLPTHNTKYQHVPTFDKEKDIKGNRTKRIFTDEIAKNASKAESIIVQEYHRDTGEVIADVGAPINVLGKKWGVFRVGVNFNTLKEYKTQKIIQFFIYSSIITGITVLIVFFILGIYVVPLKRLTKFMDELSTGNLDIEINQKKRRDELGDLIASIERLKDSYVVTMNKLLTLRKKIK